MKNITLFLALLLSVVGCMAQEPSTEPSRVTRPSDAVTTPRAETTSVLPPLSAATVTADITAIPAFSAQTFLWVMESGETLGDFYLIKLTAEGQELWRTQFEHSTGLGVDHQDGGVWTIQRIFTPEFETHLVKLDANGQIIQEIRGYEASLLAVDPNDGSLWLTLAENQIVKLNREGTEMVRVGGLGNPYAIAVDPGDGSVWLADGDRRQIIKFSRNGEQLFAQATPGFFSDSPQQIVINLSDSSLWHGGFEDVFKRSVDGSVLKQVHGFEAPVAVAVDPKAGTVWVSDFVSQTSGAMVKLDQNGHELLRTPLDSPPLATSIHPEDGSVWVGVAGGLIRLTADGAVLKIIPTAYSPKMVVMATVLASPAAVGAASPEVDNALVPTATVGESTPTPMPVTPTPVPEVIRVEDICSSVDSMVPDDCGAIARLLQQIDITLLRTLMNEGCMWPRLSCNMDGQVTYLDLSSYQLDSLPPEIGGLVNLQSLNLDNNNLSLLPAEIGNLIELQVLGLHGNQLNTVPTEIGQLANLQQLSLNYNPLSTLPPEIGQLTSLQELHLWSVDLQVLPAEIGDLAQLQWLNVSAQLEALPPEIGRLINLAMLDLPGNKLSLLPAEIGNLASLMRLDLSGNQLNDLPSEVGNLTNLQHLDLSHNQLGTVPSEIGNLVHLEQLILAYNQLDMLPITIQNLTNLQEFCLYNNLLETLPPQVEMLRERTACTSYAN